jgi:hypothetical protein
MSIGIRTIFPTGAMMHFPRFLHFIARGFAAVALLSLFASSSALLAQAPSQTVTQNAVQPPDQDSHLVTPVQLDGQVQASAATRRQEIQNLTQFLSTPQATKAMKDAKVDPVQVKTAIPSLSDAELADLSARADHAQRDFAAGMSNNTLLIIILVIVAVILIAVIR